MSQPSPQSRDSSSVSFFGDFLPSFYHSPILSRVGILGTIPLEISAIARHIENAQSVNKASGNYVTGQIGNIPVVLTHSGIGNVGAALTAQKLISEFQATALIYAGAAETKTDDYVEGTSISPSNKTSSVGAEGSAVAHVCEHNQVPSITLGRSGKYGREAKVDSGKSFFAEALSTAQFVMNLFKDEHFGRYLKKVTL